MSGKKQRIKAFTIMEMTVAMVIAAVVIGIAFTSYSMISRSYGALKIKNDQVAVLSRVDQLLRRDIEHAELLSVGLNGIHLKNTIGLPIDYEFTNNYIVRKSLVTDTFKVNSGQFQFSFEGQLRDETEEPTTTDSEQNRIDEFYFQVYNQDQVIPYHYYKHYSSADLINRTAHAIN